jgi:protein TonB
VEYIQKPQPEYPAASKRMGEAGQVMLRVLVNDKGRPESVQIQKSSGFTRLDEAARQAVLRARFKPYTEDGKPIPVYAIVPIGFQLDN